jgi:hypothetical protein
MNTVWGYNVIKWVLDKDSQPQGVIIQVDNGDTQYLTMEEYNQFLQNRQENDQVEA